MVSERVVVVLVQQELVLEVVLVVCALSLLVVSAVSDFVG